MATFSASAQFKAIDLVTGPVKKMAAVTQTFAASASTSFAKVGEKSQVLSKKLDSMSSSMMSFKSLLMGTAIVGAAKWLYDTALAAAKASDEQLKFTERAGISMQTFKELNYAANKSGVSTEELSRWFEKLSKNMGDMKMNTGELSSFLASNDRALLSQLKHTKNNEKAFNMIVASISKVKDPTLRAAFASAAFGERAHKLTTMLMQGTAGLAAMRAEYRKYGSDSATAAASAKDLMEAQLKMDTAFKSIKSSVSVAVIPTFTKIIEKTADWMAENKKMVKTNISMYLEMFGNILLFIVKNLNIIIPAIMGYAAVLLALKVASVITTAVSWGMVAVTWASNIAMAASYITTGALTEGLLANSAALKIVSFWESAVTAATWLFSAALWATGIPEIVIGVIALGVGIYLLCTRFKQIVAWFKEMGTTAKIVTIALAVLFAPVILALAPFILIGYAIKKIIQYWGGLSKAFESGGFLKGIKAVGKAILSIILAPIQLIIGLISKITGANWAKQATKGIEDFRTGVDTQLTLKGEGKSAVNKDAAAITQRKITENTSTQNATLTINDNTGRSTLGGKLSPIPIVVHNTKLVR